MQGNRRRNTEPELLLRAALRRVGLRGYRLDVSGLAGRPDIAFTRWRLAIFVHGCFWHRCPYCKPSLPKAHRAFWKRKFDANAERDERKRRQLEAEGWTVMEVWECRIERDADASARRVASRLERIKRHLEADEDLADLRARLDRASVRNPSGRT
jgi:DNA mismatch endonuclease, patch repair protein